MKNNMTKLFGFTASVFALTITQNAIAIPTNIIDGYVGGINHGYGDVIGSTADFDISSMDVERIGNTLSVSINTGFAGKGDNGLFSAYTYDGMGIGYGDLFLSSSWTPYGAAPYASDNSTNGTTWSYAFSLDDRYTDGGSGSLYSLNGDNSDVLLSEDFLKGAIFRNGQEIAVDTTGKTAINSNSWDITTGSINFLIDLTGTSLEGSDTIALHWGMTCGNDTIEGEYSVPEPTMLGLLAIGMIAIGCANRRRNI
jgi:hypothetical protein